MDAVIDSVKYTISDPLPDPSLRVVRRNETVVGYIGRSANRHILLDANRNPMNESAPIAGDDSIAGLVRTLHYRLDAD